MGGEIPQEYGPFQSSKECVAVLIGLYKKNGAVSRAGIDFYFIWSLYLVRTWLVIVQFARNEKRYLS